MGSPGRAGRRHGARAQIGHVDVPSAGRLLGIDAGERRVGLAVSDPSQLLATPLSVLVRGESQNPIAERVATVAHEEQAVGVIVGLPLNEDGSEGRQAHRARHFAAMVEKSSHLPVVLSDERFSTIEAASVQKSQGRRRRQGKGKQEGYLDALAAALILQRFLDQNHPPSMLSAEEAR